MEITNSQMLPIAAKEQYLLQKSGQPNSKNVECQRRKGKIRGRINQNMKP